MRVVRRYSPLSDLTSNLFHTHTYTYKKDQGLLHISVAASDPFVFDSLKVSIGIEFFFYPTPVGTISIHPGLECRAMTMFPEMCELMQHDILQCFRLVLGQLQIQPYPGFQDVTGPPAGLHVADTTFLRPLAYDGFAARQQRWDCLFQHTTVPAVDDFPPLFHGCVIRYIEQDPLLF